MCIANFSHDLSPRCSDCKLKMVAAGHRGCLAPRARSRISAPFHNFFTKISKMVDSKLILVIFESEKQKKKSSAYLYNIHFPKVLKV